MTPSPLVRPPPGPNQQRAPADAAPRQRVQGSRPEGPDDPFVAAARALLLFAAGPDGSDGDSASASGYQVGLTKVFLKGHLAASLDRKRALAISNAATRIQAAFR